MNWRSVDIVAFDTETTGLSPFQGDRVIEVAAVRFRLDPAGVVQERSEHSWLINPGMPIPRQATEITGITDKDVARAPRFDDVAEEVFDLLKNAITVAHNYAFDLAFLTNEFLIADLCWPEPIAEVDTLDLSHKHFGNARGHKLQDVCERLGVSLVGAHRATNDATACGECFVELARRHQVADELQAMLDWANAIGRPPSDAPFGTDDLGRLTFREGPHAGEPIAFHPIHLAWMEKARERRNDAWDFR